MRVDTADDSPCEVEAVGKLVFGKWASHLLWALAQDDPMSFSALCASAPRATPKVITARLRQLECDGLITRHRFREAPPRTEYRMTPLGRSLIPVFRELVHWWEQNLAEVSQARARYGAGTNTPQPVLAANSQILTRQSRPQDKRARRSRSTLTSQFEDRETLASSPRQAVSAGARYQT